MPTYYIQITSPWQGDRWHTCYQTDDPRLADFLAKGLAVSENQFGEHNPGIAGKRLARAISKTRLQRREGVAAVRKAEADLELGFWDDAPARSWNDTDPIPANADIKRVRGRTMVTYEHHTPQAVAEDVQKLLEAWESEKAAQAKSGVVDFLIRDIPGDLHAVWKEEAHKKGISMNQLIIEALKKYLTDIAE